MHLISRDNSARSSKMTRSRKVHAIYINDYSVALRYYSLITVYTDFYDPFTLLIIHFRILNIWS